MEGETAWKGTDGAPASPESVGGGGSTDGGIPFEEDEHAKPATTATAATDETRVFSLATSAFQFLHPTTQQGQCQVEKTSGGRSLADPNAPTVASTPLIVASAPRVPVDG